MERNVCTRVSVSGINGLMKNGELCWNVMTQTGLNGPVFQWFHTSLALSFTQMHTTKTLMEPCPVALWKTFLWPCGHSSNLKALYKFLHMLLLWDFNIQALASLLGVAFPENVRHKVPVLKVNKIYQLKWGPCGYFSFAVKVSDSESVLEIM